MSNYGPAIIIAAALMFLSDSIERGLRHIEINLHQTIKVQDEPTPPAKAGKTT